MLIDLRKRLGIGHLSAISAHNTSRPQVKWTVTSKLECAVLSDVLDAHPLRARKLAEYEIWREALSVWCVRRYGLAPGGEARLADLAAAIHAARVYREPAADEAVPSLMDAYAHQYLAGFFSGEGCFQLGPRRARLTVKVRRDDRPLLEGFRRRFRMGSVCDVAVPEPWSPCAAWNVTAAREVLRGIAIFDRAGLLGRKARQFHAWRSGAEAVALAKIGRLPVNDQTFESSRRALAVATAYRAPPSSLVRDEPAPFARDAYVDVLRTWAALTEGPLTCTAYQAMRRSLRPYWPKRETIAAEFGGWAQALREADLTDRVSARSARQLRV